MTLTNGKAIYETTTPYNTNTIILNRWFLMFINLTPDTIPIFLVTLSPTNNYYEDVILLLFPSMIGTLR